jgi:hypothetical protein
MRNIFLALLSIFLVSQVKAEGKQCFKNVHQSIIVCAEDFGEVYSVYLQRTEAVLFQKCKSEIEHSKELYVLCHSLTNELHVWHEGNYPGSAITNAVIGD